MIKILKDFFKKDEKKQDYTLPKNHGLEAEKVYGYLNPFWKIRLTHKGREVLVIPFSFLVATYLKDYGFLPETMVNPSIKVELDLGLSSPVSCPLYVQEKCTFQDNITIEEAVKKGMIYKSSRRS